MPNQLVQEMEVMKTSKSKWLLLLLVPIIVLLDQYSKIWVLETLQLGQTIKLIPGLNLTLAHNYGVAFGMFNDNVMASKVILLGVAVAITLLISVWFYKTPTTQKLEQVSLVFILGGALGNIIDRVSHGYVIDFIDVYVNGWHWWTFNIADSFITIGALLLLKTILFEKKQ